MAFGNFIVSFLHNKKKNSKNTIIEQITVRQAFNYLSELLPNSISIVILVED